MKKFIIIGISALVLVVSGYTLYWYLNKGDVEVVGSESSGQKNLESIRPRDMKIVETGKDYFIVEWETSSSVVGYVRYGDTSTSLQFMSQDVKGSVLLKHHRVRVGDLKPGRKYYFWVMSDGIAFGKNGRSLEVLTTSE